MKINTLFIDLQYESLLVSQQREAFDQFLVRLREKFFTSRSTFVHTDGLLG
jgi:hypothetical protein